MRNIKTTGIIIKRIDVGEADKILTIMTHDQGKIQVKAKGVRKITSHRSSHVDLFNHTEVSLYKSTRMPILTEAQTIESYSDIKNDLTKVGLAYHICELIDGLCPENQENREAFFLLKDLLDELSTSRNLGQLIHDFEIRLLQNLGYYSEQDLTGSKASFFIESILEKKLKTRQILPQLI